MHASMCVSAWRAAADHNILLGTYVLCAYVYKLHKHLYTARRLCLCFLLL